MPDFNAISKQSPYEALLPKDLCQFDPKPGVALMDSASDVHLVIDSRMFYYLVKSDLPECEVGKDGETVQLVGMGPALVGLRLTDSSGQVTISGFIIERAYLPAEGQSANHIWSTGRLWAKQGTSYIGEDVNQLAIGGAEGEFRAQCRFRNFTPILVFLPGLPGDAMAPRVCSHMKGRPKHESLRIAHLRLGHMSNELVAKSLGLQSTRLPPCHCCRQFKAETPSATSTPEYKLATERGGRVSFDAWGPFPHAAFGTSWKYILAAVDEAENLVDAIGSDTPNGARCAAFAQYILLYYKQVYKVTIKRMRCDNASVFKCEQVDVVMSSWTVLREYSAEYMHWQIRMERYFKTMLRWAACMLGFAKREKSYFIHACLHALDIMTVFMINEGEELPRFEVASGVTVPYDMYRIFGADMYGTLLPEKRKQMKLTKADIYAVHGVFIGCNRVKRTWKLANVAKVHEFGAGIIDETSLLARAPRAHLESFDDLTALTRDGKTVYTCSGEQVEFGEADAQSGEPMPKPALANAPAADAEQAQPAAALQRPRREARPVVPLDPSPAQATRKAVVAPPAEQPVRSLAQVLVPHTLWPRMTCDENNGEGWLADVISRKRGANGDEFLKVRFVNARTPSGGKWLDIELRPWAVLHKSADGAWEPLPCDTRAAVRMHALAIADSPAALAHELDPNYERLPELLGEAACLDASHGDVMRVLAIAAGPPSQVDRWAKKKAKPKRPRSILTTIAGKPCWMPKPYGWKEARKLPNGPRWEMAETAFLDKTEAVDGFTHVHPSEAQGSPIYRLNWVYSYKAPDGDEKARLVWDNTSNEEGFSELVYSGTAKPLHWKALVHDGMCDAAEIVRVDIENAHQTTRRGPLDNAVYSYGIPGRPKFITGSDGLKVQALVRWDSYLNGMPTVGRAFNQDLSGILGSESLHAQSDEPAAPLRATVSDPYVWVWFSVDGKKYLKTARIVDDLLIIAKGDGVIERFVNLLERRWNVKRMALDGFLNNQYYVDITETRRTVTICMDVRLQEIMREYLPDECDRAAFPDTPSHPDIKSLALGTVEYEHSSLARRLNAMLMYVVVQVYYNAQYPVFYAARYSSAATPLYFEVNLYALRHLYGTRHIGLTLGGDVGAEGVVSGTVLVGMTTDAGHAEAGPSTGGHSLELEAGSGAPVTIHCVSGQHHATTLATTDSEMYELSRGVASVLAFRMFMTEIGRPQDEPSTCRCDNSGVCFQAADNASDKRSLYMRRRKVFVATAQETEEISVKHIEGVKNRADILTKPLGVDVYCAMRDLILNVRHAVRNVHAHVCAMMRAAWG